MAWTTFLELVLGSSLMLAQQPAAAPTTNSPHLEEVLSYACARSVAGLVDGSEQMGPLFSEGSLIFTSLEAQDTTSMLLVNAGYGNFVLPLAGSGVNRIRFAIPTSKAGPLRQFFLSYLHGGTLRSRFFEFSESRPPLTKDEWEYTPIEPQRADYLQPHLDYAITVTAESTLSAITDGRIAREHLLPHRVENCTHIARLSPMLGRNLQYSLDHLDMIVMGPSLTPKGSAGGRMPASVQPASAKKKNKRSKHVPLPTSSAYARK